MMKRLINIIVGVAFGFLMTLGVGLVSGEVVYAANDEDMAAFKNACTSELGGRWEYDICVVLNKTREFCDKYDGQFRASSQSSECRIEVGGYKSASDDEPVDDEVIEGELPYGGEIDTSIPSSIEEAINRLPNAGNNLSGDFLKTLLNWIYALGGLIAVVIIIYGGIKYNAAQGDPGKVKQAGQIIAFAIVGLVIVLLAAAITAFATGTIGGAI